MTAAINVETVKPVIIFATNQKNNPLITKENNPRVIMLIGKVSSVTTGLTTIFKNTRQAATTIAVIIELTAIPSTKYGKENTARVVINQRSMIILCEKLFHYPFNCTAIRGTANLLHNRTNQNPTLCLVCYFHFNFLSDSDLSDICISQRCR